jgi:hypothetical protein
MDVDVACSACCAAMREGSPPAGQDGALEKVWGSKSQARVSSCSMIAGLNAVLISSVSTVSVEKPHEYHGRDTI